MHTSSSGTATPIDLENAEPEGYIRKHLTVTFRDLNVRVNASNAALGSTLLSVVDPRQLCNIFARKQQPMRVGSTSLDKYTRSQY